MTSGIQRESEQGALVSSFISRLPCILIRDDDSIPGIHGPGASPGPGALIAIYNAVLLSKSSCQVENANTEASNMKLAQNSMSISCGGLNSFIGMFRLYFAVASYISHVVISEAY